MEMETLPTSSLHMEHLSIVPTLTYGHHSMWLLGVGSQKELSFSLTTAQVMLDMVAEHSTQWHCDSLWKELLQCQVVGVCIDVCS